jgi:hypothetical protein
MSDTMALTALDEADEAPSLRERLREWPQRLAVATRQMVEAHARVEVARRRERVTRVTLQAVARARGWCATLGPGWRAAACLARARGDGAGGHP